MESLTSQKSDRESGPSGGVWKGIRWRGLVLIALAVPVAVALARTPGPRFQPTRGAQRAVEDPSPEKVRKPFSVDIRRPAEPRIDTGLRDTRGQPITVGCDTCHTNRAPDPRARLGVDLKTFHQGLKGAHGDLACVACHHPGEGYRTLRLADGRSVLFSESIQLCGQCHGPQLRAYQHGAHGGMNGFWDLQRGPRIRNTCIDCHDAHAPRYPMVRPARGPQDRFLTPGDRRTDHE